MRHRQRSQLGGIAETDKDQPGKGGVFNLELLYLLREASKRRLHAMRPWGNLLHLCKRSTY